MKIMKRVNVITGIGLMSVALTSAGCASSKPKPVVQIPEPQMEVRQEVAVVERSSIMGAPGPQGPVGPAGEQGERGLMGEPGVAVAGPRGVAGPAGPVGVRGETGAAGPEGAIAIGAAGVRGPAGPAGSQGARGVTGVQGASAAGIAGPAGVAGPQGPQGSVGMTGARGPTLIGPTGPAGAAGTVGAQGDSGRTGAQGSTMAGVAGAAGVAGPAGIAGGSGATGGQGETGVIDVWTSYRDFWFESDRAEIHSADSVKIAEIVSYMKKNASLQVGIDGTADPNGSDPVNNSLRDRRIEAIRLALVKAGLSEQNIRIGALGDPKTRRDRRVEVLIKTYQVTQAR